MMGMTPDAFDIYRREDDLEHNSQAELRRNPPTTEAGLQRRAVMEDLRKAEAKLQVSRRKRPRWSLAPSASGSLGTSEEEEVEHLEQRVKDLKAQTDLLTDQLGEGRNSSGAWVNAWAPRGIVARCSLAFKNARGATCIASGSAVVGTTCTNVGCIVEEHLAICYYCHQPLCPDHRVLISTDRSKKNSTSRSGTSLTDKPKGGATCGCLDHNACRERQRMQAAALPEGRDAKGGKAARKLMDQQRKGKGPGDGHSGGYHSGHSKGGGGGGGYHGDRGGGSYHSSRGYYGGHSGGYHSGHSKEGGGGGGYHGNRGGGSYHGGGGGGGHYSYDDRGRGSYHYDNYYKR